MRAIRGKDTRPEMYVRKALHAAGFRYRLHSRDLPGKPDLVLPKYRAVVFVHGCFWHQHNCSMFKMPTERRDFWREKITGNATRDAATRQKLLDQGWRVAIIWECALKGRNKLPAESLVRTLAEWLSMSSSRTLEIVGSAAV